MATLVNGSVLNESENEPGQTAFLKLSCDSFSGKLEISTSITAMFFDRARMYSVVSAVASAVTLDFNARFPRNPYGYLTVWFDDHENFMAVLGKFT